MTGLLPHPDGDGHQCLHCDAKVSSLWRPANVGPGHVCRCNDCHREEGWLPPKRKRGRKSNSNTGAEVDLPLVLLPVSSISSITKVEAHRCLGPHDPSAPALRLRALVP